MNYVVFTALVLFITLWFLLPRIDEHCDCAMCEPCDCLDCRS